MFFDYSILNELKRVPTDAPEDERDKYNLDDEDTGGTETEPTNYDLEVDEEEEPVDEDEGYDLDNEEDEPTDGEPTEDEPTDEEPGDEDEGYDLDNNMDEENPEEEPTEDEPTDEEPETNSDNELKDLENKIFNIGKTGLDIRERTLKQDYLILYNNINTILDKIRLVPKTSVNISVIEFCNKKLYELKTICYDYLLYTYSDKTYIENQKNYITYVSIIANINNLLIQIQPKME